MRSWASQAPRRAQLTAAAAAAWSLVPQVVRVHAAAATEQEAETGNFAAEFTQEIVDEEKK